MAWGRGGRPQRSPCPITRVSSSPSDNCTRTAAPGETPAALRSTLTESQVLIAAGGLQAQIEATNALDGFRGLPKQAFEAEVGPYAQELASDSPDSSAQEVEALLRDAVSLGDREYEENKTKLVRQLQPFFAPAGQAADQRGVIP